MSLDDQDRDVLDVVEDEILLLLKDSEALLSHLKDLPEKEQAVTDVAKSLLEHLSKAQEGLLDNITLLADYLPFEYSATQSRLRSRQAKADITAACSALETFPQEDFEDSLIGEEYRSDPSSLSDERAAKRMRPHA